MSANDPKRTWAVQVCCVQTDRRTLACVVCIQHENIFGPSGFLVALDGDLGSAVLRQFGVCSWTKRLDFVTQ
jgi:hypothetical protein